MSASITTPAQLEALIQNATSESIPHGAVDLTIALEVSDVIRSRRILPKEGMRCLKKRIISTRSNPNTNLSSWTLVELCLKNCGIPFIKEICSREFMDALEHAILDNESNEELERMCKGILQNLYVAFKNDSQLNYVSKVYQRLTSRGVDFPSNLTSDSELATAMFDSKTPADWVDSDVCMICSVKFTLLNRKHHCRSCGGIFCQEHSSHRIPLPDLGIYEPVRACDDCYDEYEYRRQSGKKHQKKKKQSGKKSGASVQEQEDEQLKRAIEMSLRESRNSDTFVPVVSAAPAVKESSPPMVEEEQDEDLKAAIQASLRDAEELKRRQENTPKQHSAELNNMSQHVLPRPSYGISTSEEDDIQLFATLVERMKSQPATAVLEDTQLQQLYQKVMGTVPKLNYSLNDASQKYNTMVSMNSKISDIMNIYDSLLEKQLQSISLNQQYSMPQLPSDPYAYYNVAQQDSHLTASQSPRTQIPYRLPVSISDSNSFVGQRMGEQTRQSYSTSPAQKHRIQHSPHRSHVEELRGVAIDSLQHSDLEKNQQRPYPDEAQDGELANGESDITYSKNENPLNHPSEPPYPNEDEEPVKKINNPSPERTNGITNFDFPTVPLHQPPVKERETTHLEEPHEREELLIEL